MQPQAALRRSIARHGVISFLAQAAALLAVFAGYRMPWPRFALYLGVSAAYHGLLTGLLIARSADFTVEGSSGVVLPRVNLATSLTFVRLSSIPTVMFLVIQAARYPLLPVVLPAISIVFLTDLLDGLAARRRHQVTFVGRYLDSTSDYLMIIAVSVLFFYFRLIPAWFFALIVSRLVLFAAGMAVLTLKQGKADPLATFLGKASVFATMVLYVLELAEHFRLPGLGYPPVVRIVEYLTAAVIVASVVDKVIFLARMFAAASRGGGHKGAGPGSL